MDDSAAPLLEIEDLETHYPITKGILRREVGRIRAVDGVSFAVHPGEAFGLIGESGCGKTTAARSALDLEEPTGGVVRFDGRRVDDLSGKQRREFRRRAQLVVQDTDGAFNPRTTIGAAVAEPLQVHGLDDPDRRREIVTDLLERVGLAPDDADRYPHEFSGGERQRIAIARALSVDPDLIVADEPTSGLDGRVRSNVLGLLERVRDRFDVAILLISHDVDVVRRFCDRVAVMYLGKIVEKGPAEAVLDSPDHPYTRVLAGSVPSLDPGATEFADPLTDAIPDPADPPSGCRFHTRCPELIPPPDLDVSHGTWQSLAALRFAAQTGELPGEVDPGAPATDAAAVRGAFDLRGDLPDGLRRTVEDAADAIAHGDLESANARLADALPTVCERNEPATVEHDGCEVACHRYDPEAATTPLEFPDGPPGDR